MKKPMSKDAAFHEIYANPPKAIARAGKTGEAARDMKIAIALSKAGLSKPGKNAKK